MFQFEGEQNFINFAGVGFFSGQVNIARHLHGDGGSALAFAFAQVGNAGANQAQIVQTTMLIKACIFNRQHGIFHNLRNLFDGREVAALFAELSHQCTIGGVNAQGQFGAVFCQVRSVRQLRIGHHHGHTDHHQQ